MMCTLNLEISSTNLPIMLDERCKSCFDKTYKRLLEKFNAGMEQNEEFNRCFQEIILNEEQLSSPAIQGKLSEEFCRIINLTDPFKEEKAHSNQIAISLYKRWKPKVLSSVNPFDLALRLSIAGNIMDYGANNRFDVNETIKSVLKASYAINHSTLLKNHIGKAKSILYLGDNAGEIVFDKLFIETISHPKVYYAVKDAPILNDVTMMDAKEAGMDLVAEVISNGDNTPSTVLSKCSTKFLEIYHSVDLIISKGQGNFEGLLKAHDPRIFFLLMVKCDVIAELLQVDKGSFVVYNKTNQWK